MCAGLFSFYHFHQELSDDLMKSVERESCTVVMSVVS